ncbi:MAG: extensin family protein, partial [Pseudomonadota bacterium]
LRSSSGLSQRMSQHATANAFDISGFLLTDGRMVTLRRDWQGSGPKAAFLRAARDGLCRWFRLVLSPDYNALHADHFHVDQGPFPSCR